MSELKLNLKDAESPRTHRNFLALTIDEAKFLSEMVQKMLARPAQGKKFTMKFSRALCDAPIVPAQTTGVTGVCLKNIPFPLPRSLPPSA